MTATHVCVCLCMYECMYACMCLSLCVTICLIILINLNNEKCTHNFPCELFLFSSLPVETLVPKRAPLLHTALRSNSFFPNLIGPSHGYEIFYFKVHSL